jgi:hypothetical protein
MVTSYMMRKSWVPRRPRAVELVHPSCCRNLTQNAPTASSGCNDSWTSHPADPQRHVPTIVALPSGAVLLQTWFFPMWVATICVVNSNTSALTASYIV